VRRKEGLDMAVRKSTAKRRAPAARAAVEGTKRGRPYTPPAADLASSAEGPQVERLQSFLAKFGYIQSPILGTFGVADRMAAAPPQTGSF
jgi:hypothetical protein